MVVGDAADVSEAHAASIFRVEVFAHGPHRGTAQEKNQHISLCLLT
jgi:hypothetical protein